MLTGFVTELSVPEIGVYFGYIWVFSALLVIIKWQRNMIEDKRQEKVRQQSTHDQLTGLPNRTLFHDRLTQTLVRMERNESVGAILYLDLDDFKNVNDEYSHVVGDNVLKIIAERIQGCIREADTSARFSGDEFVILLEDVGVSENAAQIALQILENISVPIHIQNSEVIVSGSIGIAMIPKDGKDNSELLIHADTAMYNAKNDGKNAVSFFTNEMKETMLNHINMGKSLHSALERQEFYMEYQPQYDSRTGKVFGAEALLRWQHPELGYISPRDFIPIAEKNGMIIPIGKSVIAEVIEFHQDLESALNQNIRISANISGRQLRDNQFTNYLSTLIDHAGIDPSNLELEVTENSIFDNIEHTLSILKKLKSLGVRLAIDDFGIGYSSLSYLERLPFDTVKIDISFIRKIRAEDVQLPILAGIISIATELGLDVIAEGVENETQLNYLKSHGCHLIQGRYFQFSLSEEVLLRILTDQDGYVLQPPVPVKMAHTW
jgi:diguanylate cyclase (GGDEF)-like protein